MADGDIDDALRRVGANIRAHRLRLELTQGELAERIGVQPLFIRVLETGRRAPSFRTLVKLIGALELEPNQLFEARELVPNPVGRPRKKAP